MEAIAKYDFEATADDELRFRKGDELRILQNTGNWYTAELRRVEGLVPKNFIIFHLPSWYKEGVGHSDTQGLMSQPVGAFLVRGLQSTSPGNFCISVRTAKNVQHFKVLRDSRGQYFLWSETFSSLNQLVEYYKTNSISKNTYILLKEMGQQQRSGSNEFPPAPLNHPVFDHSPAPAPQQHRASSTRQVKALYSFRAEEAEELDFNQGDIIEILECPTSAWWRGQLRGKTGLIPSNYTSPI